MNLDFRTKIFMVVMISTICATGKNQQEYPFFFLLLSLVPSFCLLTEKRYSLTIKSSGLILLAFWLNRHGLEFLPGTVGFIISLIALLIVKMLPAVLIAYYAITSTGMSDLVASLQKMKLPDAITIPISIMFRFFYSVKEDYFYINDAMKMHGLTLSRIFSQPVRLVEYKIVPLLMCSVNVADDVTISAMTRGMAVGEKRTTISMAKLRLQDYIVMLLLVLLLVVYVRSFYA